jgi:hypothetical protein
MNHDQDQTFTCGMISIGNGTVPSYGVGGCRSEMMRQIIPAALRTRDGGVYSQLR